MIDEAKKAAYNILGHSTIPEHLSDLQTAEKIAPPFWASQLETGNRHEHGFERLIVKKP